LYYGYRKWKKESESGPAESGIGKRESLISSEVGCNHDQIPVFVIKSRASHPQADTQGDAAPAGEYMEV